MENESKNVCQHNDVHVLLLTKNKKPDIHQHEFICVKCGTQRWSEHDEQAPR